MTPVVSVIIPTYGKPVFLRESIQSVINQSFRNWELIVVDDNNPNTVERKMTSEIMESYKDDRIKYILHPYNKNGAAARNTGIKVSQGRYISFLDSDDIYLPERLKISVEVLENLDTKYAGVYTGCEFRKNGKTYRRYTAVHDGNYLVDTLACKFMFCTGSNIFIRREVVLENNGFDESFLRHQDYEFLVRIFQNYSLKAINQILVIKNNENFNLPNIEKMYEIKKQYLGKFENIIDKLSEVERNYIYHSNTISLAEQSLRQGKVSQSNMLYKKAKEFSPITLSEWKRRLLLPFLKFVNR